MKNNRDSDMPLVLIFSLIIFHGMKGGKIYIYIYIYIVRISGKFSLELVRIYYINSL